MNRGLCSSQSLRKKRSVHIDLPARNNRATHSSTPIQGTPVIPVTGSQSHQYNKSPHPMRTPPGDTGPPLPSTEDPGSRAQPSLSPRGPPVSLLLSHIRRVPSPTAGPARLALAAPAAPARPARTADRTTWAHTRGNTLRPHRPSIGGECACQKRSSLCGGAWCSPRRGVLKGQERQEGPG